MTIDEHICKAEADAKMVEFETERGICNYFKDRTEALEYAKECRNLAKWLEELKELKEQTRWIPVSERLPKEDGEYLTTVKGIGCDYNEIRCFSENLYEVNESEFCDKKGPGWYYFDHEYGDIEETDVIAWMPLPKPYTAESEES